MLKTADFMLKTADNEGNNQKIGLFQSTDIQKRE